MARRRRRTGSKRRTGRCARVRIKGSGMRVICRDAKGRIKSNRKG